MDYETLLNALRDGKIDQIEITPENFPAFQKFGVTFRHKIVCAGLRAKQGTLNTFAQINRNTFTFYATIL